jgi:hypothetical protein
VELGGGFLCVCGLAGVILFAGVLLLRHNRVPSRKGDCR